MSRYLKSGRLKRTRLPLPRKERVILVVVYQQENLLTKKLLIPNPSICQRKSAENTSSTWTSRIVIPSGWRIGEIIISNKVIGQQLSKLTLKLWKKIQTFCNANWTRLLFSWNLGSTSLVLRNAVTSSSASTKLIKKKEKVIKSFSTRCKLGFIWKEELVKDGFHSLMML
jgi:hypothetical protein